MMMNKQNSTQFLWLTIAASAALGTTAVAAQAPATQAKDQADQTQSRQTTAAKSANRAQSYYHSALAAMYEEEAVNSGRPEFVQHAIEEYKTAINADPGSAELQDSLAELYFRTGRARDAESAARQVLLDHPSDVGAHKLLGRIYLRRLGDQQNAAGSSTASGNTLDEAIAEFEKIVALQPKSVEDHMVLGKLYGVKQQSAKAEEQFKIAQALDPDSEEVILNLARAYGESGDFAQAAKVIENVPESDRTGRMEFTLGATYEQMKRPKDAIAAYQRAFDEQPDDVPTMSALAQAQLNDNQLDAALKTYSQIATADPENAAPLIKISEIQRRQQKYEDALTTIRKARKKDPESLEAGYDEGLLLDVLGHYDEAAATYSAMVDETSHANGAYTPEEKNNRGIFLDRLGAVYHEQNKVDQAIATYQKMIDLGGDQAKHGYQSEVDIYNDAHQFDKAVDVSKQAMAAFPKDVNMKLMLAGELVNQGKVDDGLNMTKALLSNSGDDRTVYFALGNMYTRLRRWKDAEEALDKAAPLATKKEDKLYLLFLEGALADREKHMDQAEKYFRQALEVDPENAMTLNYLGYMFADKGVRLPEALKLIRKAVELDPMNGAYLDSLGWAYFKLGEYELAEENLRQAVERDQTDPTVHDHLGDLYEKTGRIRLAAAQWELSIADFQKTPSIDVEPGDMSKVQHKLESARVKLAKQESLAGDVSKP